MFLPLYHCMSPNVPKLVLGQVYMGVGGVDFEFQSPYVSVGQRPYSLLPTNRGPPEWSSSESRPWGLGFMTAGRTFSGSETLWGELIVVPVLTFVEIHFRYSD